MIKLLPHWCLTSKHPAFYDTESGSSIEQTATIYAKMQELVADYNNFVDSINKHIIDYETGITKDFEDFRKCITKVIENYIESLDIRVDNQDAKIENQNKVIAEYEKQVKDAVLYFKDNVETTVHTLIDEMKASGEFDDIVLNSLDELNNKYSNLSGRIDTLENKAYIYVYDSYNESLNLELREVITSE